MEYPMSKPTTKDADTLQVLKDKQKVQLKALLKTRKDRLAKVMSKCRAGICTCRSGACWHGEQYVAQLIMAKACQRLGEYERYPFALSLTMEEETHPATMAQNAQAMISKVAAVLDKYEDQHYNRYLYLEAVGVVVPHIQVFRPGDVRWSLVLDVKVASRTVNEDDWSDFERSDELAQLGVDDPSAFVPHMDGPHQFDSVLRADGKFHATESPLSAEHRATYAGWLHDMSGYQRILHFGFSYDELFGR